MGAGCRNLQACTQSSYDSAEWVGNTYACTAFLELGQRQRLGSARFETTAGDGNRRPAHDDQSLCGAGGYAWCPRVAAGPAGSRRRIAVRENTAALALLQR